MAKLDEIAASMNEAQQLLTKAAMAAAPEWRRAVKEAQLAFQQENRLIIEKANASYVPPSIDLFGLDLNHDKAPFPVGAGGVE